MMDTSDSGVTAEKIEGQDLLSLRPRTPEEKEGCPASSLEGIGSSKLYGNLARAKVDGYFVGRDKPALQMAHYLLHKEGLFVGGSAGLNVVGAYMLAKKLGPGHTIVTFLCDGGSIVTI
eukprot:TRINITY_DN10699_c0_g1_i2.p1 TRINITY_DN10699_c0_g1~~TRINITY_DN10699_c0_g1_i2.p1  ORF type:complete len:119 (-),score=1.10 TRINITY_DN10699_c0_g1_i2:177-533(-)